MLSAAAAFGRAYTEGMATVTCSGCRERDARMQELVGAAAGGGALRGARRDRADEQPGEASAAPEGSLAEDPFACQSARGCRFVERLLTVVQTPWLQRGPVLGYLQEALVAHRNGLPAPSLLSYQRPLELSDPVGGAPCAVRWPAAA